MVTIGMPISLVAATLVLNWGGLANWVEWLLAAYLWFIPGLFLLVFIPLHIWHFVFRGWPMDVIKPDGEIVSSPPKDWKRPQRGPMKWIGRIALLCVAGLLVYAGQPILAAGYLFLLVTGPVFMDGMEVKQGGWDSHVLPPFARARYTVLAGFYRLLWRVLQVPLFVIRAIWPAFKYIFTAIAAVFMAFVWLYENNIVARRAMQVLFWILVSPVVVVAAPFIFAWDRRAARRDSRGLRVAFDRPGGLVYFLYSEPHQYECFLGKGGVLHEVRGRVVARDWRADVRACIDESGWEAFKETAEGRMLSRLQLTNMREHLPAVIVARPRKWIKVFRFSEQYRKRRRDGGKSLENEERCLRRAIKWALPV